MVRGWAGLFFGRRHLRDGAHAWQRGGTTVSFRLGEDGRDNRMAIFLRMRAAGTTRSSRYEEALAVRRA